jgi:S-(hydroxymethyl)glutathione dehydrogenase/alcohol dehydrogenase
MRTRGAVIRQAPGSYEVVDLELDDPRPGEVQVRMVASGLCHSDDHIATGDLPVGVYHYAGGHEGAGIVTKAPPNRKGIDEGDHVVFSFIPACGHCRFCASGMQNLCQLGAGLLSGSRWADGSYRLHTPDGAPVGQMSGISTLTETTTASVDSLVTIEKDLPLESMCLLGCGVGTGWGSAVNSAQVEPGETVIVMGAGGIGINAVQGAAHAGASNIIACDPVAFKREKAQEFGATHACESMAEATELAKQFTGGQGADSAIVTVGVTTGEHVGRAFAAIRKAGTCVVTGVGNVADVGVPIPLGELTLYEKRLQGSLFGASNPTWNIPQQVQLYRDGVLKLDEFVTSRYRLDDVVKGYEDMHAGTNVRGIVSYES